MKKAYRGYLVLILLMIFFVSSFLYTAPDRYTSDSARQVSAYVVKPWLKQNWQLFGPDLPPGDYRLMVVLDDTNEIELISYLKNKGFLNFPVNRKVAIGLYNWCLLLDGEIVGGTGFYQKFHNKVVLNVLHYLGIYPQKFSSQLLRKNQIVHASVWQKSDI